MIGSLRQSLDTARHDCGARTGGMASDHHVTRRETAHLRRGANHEWRREEVEKLPPPLGLQVMAPFLDGADAALDLYRLLNDVAAARTTFRNT